MIAIANILVGIGSVLDMLLMTMIILLFVRSIVSWVNADPYNPIVRFLTVSTEPLIRPIRRWVPPLGGTFDFAPLLVFVLLFFLRYAVAQTIIDYGVMLRRGALVGALIVERALV